MTCNLTIATWNANGVRGAEGTLTDFLKSHAVDVMAVSETKLTPTDKLQLKDYTTYRLDRPDAVNAGGVALLIHKNVPHAKIKTMIDTSAEVIGVRLVDGTHLLAAYNRPSNRLAWRDLHNIFETASRVLVAGDFNCKHPTWNCNRSNPNGTLLKDFADDNDLQIHNTDDPTHYPANGMTPTTIDLIITKNLIGLTKPISLPELESDHNPVVAMIKNQFKEDRGPNVIRINKINWVSFRRTLDKNVKINRDIPDKNAFDREVTRFIESVDSAVAKSTRKIIIDKSNNNESVTPQIKEHIRNRNKLKKIWQRTANPGLKDQVRRLNHKIRNEIRAHRNTTWDAKLHKIQEGDNTLYKIAKLLRKKRAPLGEIVDGNRTAMTDADKATMLADHYANVHDLHIDDIQLSEGQKHVIDTVQAFDRTDITCDGTYLREFRTSPSELKEAIKKLPNNKAPGEDEIRNITIKNFSNKAIVQLHYIINAVVELQYFPQAWKNAIVIPIPKAGKKSDPGNFRPISLLNTLGKLTEKILLRRLTRLDKQLKLTRDEQFGFRPRHDTSQQVVRIVTDIAFNYNKDKVTAMALLDIQKAFDRVWVQGLVFKMIENKIPANFVKLLYSYLTGRTLQVKVNRTLSEKRPIKAGVPQGSILGPKLFSIFINDVPAFAKTSLALYADDTAIYAHSFNAEVATRQVQIQVNLLGKYFDKWLIQINAAKTEAILFAKKFTNTKIITPLKVKNRKVLTQSSVKYLGVHLDTRLTYHTHIDKTLTRAKATLHALYPLFSKQSKLTSGNKLKLYKTIVRPVLTYAAPVWCSITNTTMIKPQRCQNKCLRLATNSGRYIKIKDLHDIANIEMPCRQTLHQLLLK
jgi:hypothetical protein